MIGFIYTFNSAYKESKKIFTENNDFYYSIRVKGELEKVFDRKNKEFKIFFRTIVKHLRKYENHQFISNSQIHGIINKFNQIGKLNLEDMHNAFDTTWEDLKFGENQEKEQIIMELNDFINEFHSKYGGRKKNMEKTIIEIPNHSIKGKDILNIIEEKSLRDLLHDKDEDILFDLNQYAREHPELDLCLVSWDDDFIEAVKILLNQLSFKKYIGRKLKSD